jgi:hypothetical protein
VIPLLKIANAFMVSSFVVAHRGRVTDGGKQANAVCCRSLAEMRDDLSMGSGTAAAIDREFFGATSAKCIDLQ